MRKPPRIDAARNQWRRLLEQLRAAPVTDAEKLVAEMVKDIDEVFPAPPPPQRDANVVDMTEWLLRWGYRRVSSR